MTLRTTSPHARSRWGFLTGAVVALFILVAGTALANLPGSLFEGNDGNVVVNTAGNLDWASASLPGFHSTNDLATGQQDNSFGGGTKENSVNVTVVDGSIPNSKADLGRFAVASETGSNGHVYLYLAWTRNTQSGTTNFDFEVNQAEQPDLTVPGAATLNRTVGDLLITYDFQGGSQKPTIGARRWDGSQWQPVNLAAQAPEAEVNRAPITESLASGGAITRAAFQFGEAAIDLTAANLLPSGGGEGTCAGFSSIFVKSRSSDAFTAALKDFIAPIPVDLNTCGAITISKTAKHAAAESGEIAQEGVHFTLNGEGDYVTGADGTVCISNLAQGEYEVAEIVPDGYAGQDPITVNVNAKSTCDSGSFAADFTNTPLTDITVSVDSQVDGGTASTIECDLDGDSDAPADAETAADGDGSLSGTDLEPGTYTCTIVVDP